MADAQAKDTKVQPEDKVHPENDHALVLDDCLSRSDAGGENHKDHGHDHNHTKPPSIVSAFIAALINYMLMFGLCCAYGLIMFYDDHNSKHRALGVRMNLATAMISGFLLARFSGVPVAIGGPDLNPVVFIGIFVDTLAEEIATQSNLEYPEERRLRGIGRLLAGGSTTEFCTGDHLKYHVEDCEQYHDELFATTVFAVMVSSASLTFLMIGGGITKLTRFVNFIPTSVMEAFLSCVGYKVFMYALKFTDYEPKQFIPAACIGVPLYFMKAYHIGNPAVVMPLGLLFPLLVFYVIFYAQDTSMKAVSSGADRDTVYWFDYLEDAPFWEIWTESIGKPSRINFSAWTATLPDLCIMLVVVMLDVLLKIAGTEGKLPVKVDKDFEVILYGAGNIFNTLCGGTVGYMQLKFNVINFGVMGNVVDRRAGYIYALMCGVCFFYMIEHFNYLPRFFLSCLLFFAGAGFVCENLWGSRKYLTFLEWMEIVVILLVFVLSGSLLIAVIIGAFLAGISFIRKYAKVPAIDGPPLRGGEIITNEKRVGLYDKSLRHMANYLSIVVKMKGFVFFASVTKVLNELRAQIDQQVASGSPEWRRFRYLIFDVQHLDGLDASAAKGLEKLTKEAKAAGVETMWSSIGSHVYSDMKTAGLVPDHEEQDPVTVGVFRDLNGAMRVVERMGRSRLRGIQKLWCSLHPNFAWYRTELNDRCNFEPFTAVFQEATYRLGMPWKYCRKVKIEALSPPLWTPEELHRNVYMVHSGSVGYFNHLPDFSNDHLAPDHVFIHGRFLNTEFFTNGRTKFYAVALEDTELVVIDEHQWFALSSDWPHMATQFQLTSMRQLMRDFMISSGGRTEIPEDLSQTLANLADASALETRGFFTMYTDQDVVTLPELPVVLQEDLHFAFHAYAEDVGDKKLLDWSRVRETLMFGGIMNVQLRRGDFKALEEAEFLALGQSAAMMPLTEDQISQLRNMFDEICTNGPNLDIKDITAGLRDRYQLLVPSVEIRALSRAWTRDAITKDIFVGMMSRFIRTREVYWCLLTAMRDILGKTEVLAEDCITCEMLVNRGMSKELAEEMIWSADWNEVAEGTVDVCSVLAMLTNSMPRSDLCILPAGMLPLDNDNGCKPSVPFNVDQFRSVTHEKQAYTKKPSGATPEQDRLHEVMHRVFCHRENKGILPEDWETPQKFVGRQSEVVTMSRTIRPDKVLVDEPVMVRGFRAAVYRFMEEPDSSQPAQVLSTIMAMMIMASVMTLVIQPLSTSPSEEEESLWNVMEIFFTVLFTIEFVVRLAVADATGEMTTVEFLTSPATVCDVVAVLPGYIDIAFGSNNEEVKLLRVVRLARLSRMARVARLARHSSLAAPVAVVLVVIWGIFLKHGLED